MKDSDEANVHSHVAIQYMAELVSHDSLKLIPVQFVNATSRNPNDGVFGRVTCGERVDRVFLYEIDRGNRSA